MEGHFAVTVPPSAGPGSQLNVRAPNTGQMMTVVVPAGAYAGSQFMVPLPQPKPQPKVYQVNIESTSTRPAQPVYAEQVQSPRPAPPSSPAGTFPVIVPAGHFSGMRLSVRAPNTGEMMTVVIPPGVGPGGQFAVPLPMPVASHGTRSRPKGNAAARRQYQQARRRGDGRLHKVHWGVILCGNQIYGAFVLNRRVDLHAIDATPARWRGDAGSSPLDGASTATSSPRNDLVKNYRAHPTHWLISTQAPTERSPRRTYEPAPPRLR